MQLSAAVVPSGRFFGDRVQSDASSQQQDVFLSVFAFIAAAAARQTSADGLLQPAGPPLGAPAPAQVQEADLRSGNKRRPSGATLHILVGLRFKTGSFLAS